MINAETLVSLLNDAAVSVFGGLLSASFCGATASRRNRLIFWLGMALLLLPQGAVYLLWDAGFRLRIYPLILHFPLYLLLCALTGGRLWPAVSILSAYLFCQLRRWMALLAAAVLPGELTRPLTELAVTLPLLLVLLRFIAPAFRQFMDYPAKTRFLFGLIPALYYGFDYLTRVYTGLLSSGSPAVVEFMPTVCCVSYVIFLQHNSAEERRRSLSRQTQDNLKLQLNQASRELSELRESQAMTIRYRHDLRHHLQYVYSCIENGQTERARGYITGICAEIEAQKLRRFCENEAVNLILSAFDKRAQKIGVSLDIRGGGNFSRHIPISDNDLCVLLSNALENALHACLPFAETKTPCAIVLEFRLNTQTGRLFVQISNPCQEEVRFENGLPVSSRPNHGIGVQSICAIVKRYDGGYTFFQEDGQFILRLFL